MATTPQAIDLYFYLFKNQEKCFYSFTKKTNANNEKN